ncbi:MAG: protein GrpE [Saprospiraceae bacterium]|nr:MAG: protein GrpE [Saprospiraceae bacterium]
MSKKNNREKLQEDQENMTEDQIIDQTQGTEGESIEQASGQETEAIVELTVLQQQNQELKDKYLRLFAEFDNYKKRTIKEKIDLMRTAAQDTLTALLPVLDDFDRAKKIAEDESTTETFSEGVNLVYQKLYTILKQKGLEPMETNNGPFDPELHEAVTEVPVTQEDMKGKIVDTIEKGYLLKDKIIRHAKVVVGK